MGGPKWTASISMRSSSNGNGGSRCRTPAVPQRPAARRPPSHQPPLRVNRVVTGGVLQFPCRVLSEQAQHLSREPKWWDKDAPSRREKPRFSGQDFSSRRGRQYLQGFLRRGPKGGIAGATLGLQYSENRAFLVASKPRDWSEKGALRRWCSKHLRSGSPPTPAPHDTCGAAHTPSSEGVR